MKPSIGRIVHYTIAEHDLAQLTKDASVKRNAVEVGHVYPAMIVRTWGDTEGSSVNLQVFLDGDCSYWATSRGEGDGHGQWSWPPRA